MELLYRMEQEQKKRRLAIRNKWNLLNYKSRKLQNLGKKPILHSKSLKMQWKKISSFKRK
jgi:hypothetical protein